MMPNDDWFWNGLEPGRLGVKFSWSEYLPYLMEFSPERAEWEEFLRETVSHSVAQALVSDDQTQWEVKIDQSGSAAQEYHEIFLWFQSLPREILTGLVVSGASLSLGRLVGYLKSKTGRIERRYKGQTVVVNMRVHPDMLAELAREYVVRKMQELPSSINMWSPLNISIEDNTLHQKKNIDQYIIEIFTNDHRYLFLINSSAEILELRRDFELIESSDLVEEYLEASDDSVPFAIPSSFSWPSQDGIDRSSHIAILGGCKSDPNFPDEFTRDYLLRAVQEAVKEVVPEFDVSKLSAENHEIGPAAGSVDDWVVTIFEHRESIQLALGAIVDSWALSQIVSLVARKLRSKEAIEGNRGEPVRLFLTPATLSLLCEEHVRRTYHPRANFTTEWYCLSREFYGGYVSPGHPNATLEYLILVSTTANTFRFVVLGTGEVKSLSVRQGRIDAALEIPDLFEYDS